MATPADHAEGIAAERGLHVTPLPHSSMAPRGSSVVHRESPVTAPLAYLLTDGTVVTGLARLSRREVALVDLEAYFEWVDDGRPRSSNERGAVAYAVRETRERAAARASERIARKNHDGSA
jgi:hypothetical protein